MTLSDRISPMHDASGKAAAAGLRRDPQDQAVRMGTQALIGQIMFFFAYRSVICAWLDPDNYTREHIDFIADTLIPTTSASLGLPSDAVGAKGTLA